MTPTARVDFNVAGGIRPPRTEQQMARQLEIIKPIRSAALHNAWVA